MWNSDIKKAQEFTLSILPVIIHFANGGYIEYRRRNDQNVLEGFWARTAAPMWNPDYEYRILHNPDKVKWFILPDWVLYVARDENGDAHGYQVEPFKHNQNRWDTVAGGWRMTSTFDPDLKYFKAGKRDWKDSLVKRPKKKDTK